MPAACARASYEHAPLPGVCACPLQVRKAQLKLDWERIACKTRFRKMVARSDLGVSELMTS